MSAYAPAPDARWQRAMAVADAEPSLQSRAVPRPGRGQFAWILVGTLLVHGALLAIHIDPWDAPGAVGRIAVQLVSAGMPRDAVMPALPAPVPTQDVAQQPVTRPVDTSTPVQQHEPAPPADTQDSSAPEVVAPAPASAETASDTPPLDVPRHGEARVDTSYLDNPRPGYPPLSRRLGEQGTVLLRVTVSAAGEAAAIAVEKSCGFPRLDAAAQAAVRQWRFVAAREGDTPVTSTVLVPVTFALTGQG